MTAAPSPDDLVRVALLERWVLLGRAPAHEEVGAATGMTAADVRAAYRRLAEARMIVLHPGTEDVWMGNPLSAVETRYRVSAAGGAFHAPCIWDAFGVIGMLGGTGRIDTDCPCCGEEMAIEVRGRELGAAPGGAVAHFVVPAARWWDDIGFT